MEENAPCQLSRWQLLKQSLNNLSPAEFKTAVEEDDDAVVFDVRTAGEFAAGDRLFSAENLDYLGPDFLDRLDVLDPGRNYYVYCRSGRRSVRVCTLLRNSGFSSVFNMDGGLVAWEKAFPGVPEKME